MSTKINKVPTKLSNKQRQTLDYWRVATKEIENTCLCILHLFYRNDDYANYLKYQQQFDNFKDIRQILSNIVLRTIQTDNLFLMESVVVDSVKQLINMIALNSSVRQSAIGRGTAFGRLYNETSLVIIKCMLMLKKKLRDIDDYLNEIPLKQIKFETEALKIVEMLDVFANRLNFMLKMTLIGREEGNEEIARSVIQSIELIITSVQRISLDKRSNCAALTTSPCISSEDRQKITRRTRNVWSLVEEEKPVRLNNTLDTSRFIENILSDNSLRFRDKLKAIKERIESGTNNTSQEQDQEDEIPYGWIHPTEEQIEEYICKNGGCPTSTLTTDHSNNKNHKISARERFTLKELIKIFPVETQHIRFPPNPANASIFQSKLQDPVQTNAVDEDLLEGLLWQWHEASDSESTISIRFKFEVSDINRREKWFRGYRRVLQLDPAKKDLIKREIAMVKQSKSSCRAGGGN